MSKLPQVWFGKAGKLPTTFDDDTDPDLVLGPAVDCTGGMVGIDEVDPVAELRDEMV